jgi:succinate dehydrogenase / fumarate reductase cytochrome b subunit
MTEASPGARARPLSPHVQVWRWHVTMAASILHRATGVALYGGALILAGWALALASGPGAYDAYMSVLASILGRIVLFGVTVSLFFHMANGIRHLFWDAGKGFELPTADRTAWLAFAFGLVAALVVWGIPLMLGGL